MKTSHVIGLVAGLALAGAVQTASAQSKAEIQQMDRNGDGVVTRAEWQGPAGAFRLHDTNKDGQLSGTEVFEDRDRGRGRHADQNFDDWTPRGFSELDRNGDNRLTRREWQFNRESFDLADRNHDNIVSRGEFLNAARQVGNRNGIGVERFRDFDVNNDGLIERNEWRDADVAFRNLDRNHDNRITREEFREFRDVAGTSGTVANRNYDWSDNNPYRSNPYMAGYERGWLEGKAAGREDRDRNQGWDLEGQRELEQADSGYDTRFGSKVLYQEGYRDAFRIAYGEGWDRR
jgi:Ca2+-binding EF-hand superfamily protein